MTDPTTAEDRAAARMTMDYEAPIATQPTGKGVVQGPKDVPPPPRQAQAITYLRPSGRFYKRDDRGRFGSGDGGGDHHVAIKAAGTADEVATALETALSDVMGHPVTVSLKGMDAAVARDHAEGLLQGAERFPNARLGSVSTYGPNGVSPAHSGDPQGGSYAVHTMGAYSQNNDDISFNVDSLPGTYRAGLEMSQTTGFIAVGTPTGVALHEFGHVVTSHDNVPQSAAVIAKSQPRGTRAISFYSVSDAHELAAEAFSDVMAHGAKANPLSQEIFAKIEQDYEQNGSKR